MSRTELFWGAAAGALACLAPAPAAASSLRALGVGLLGLVARRQRRA